MSYEIELTISSAKDLKNVNWRYGSLRPYAVVWVDPNSKSSTKVDEQGDTSPYWDQTLVIHLPPGPIEDHTLSIDIVHANAEEDTKPLIGSARLKMAEVLDDVGIGRKLSRSLQLKRPSGRPQGKIDVDVIIRERAYHPPPAAYYAPPYGVPAPPRPIGEYYGSQYSYYTPTAPPPSGYPYGAPPPPPPSYGYVDGPPVYVQEEKKKSKFGGMGTGLAVGAVAGALGGLAIAEGVDALEDKITDDVADQVEDDLGYDGDDF
ncbi:protein SRC2 [Mercurialis annua]|uniref:protein SRC2 n=1 Tax=Mercurialis annua TaxID=3986 RepID=UPI00215EF111|nr:protein SRC2 [Mercurialis annua]